MITDHEELSWYVLIETQLDRYYTTYDKDNFHKITLMSS